ncbi:MAG: hypothetical protein NTZ14_14195 [Hyphomicrobiales bacterium]|nr:hypothetical protein [Hyphomicrobiales bacterium]
MRSVQCPAATPARLASLGMMVWLLGGGVARADSIDGHWCSDSGRRIIIEGPAVTTPAGVRMQGDYSRHGFAFTMPGNEADAGSAVDMVLQGEQRVSVRIGPSAAQIWRRCAAGVS